MDNILIFIAFQRFFNFIFHWIYYIMIFSFNIIYFFLHYYLQIYIILHTFMYFFSIFFNFLNFLKNIVHHSLMFMKYGECYVIIEAIWPNKYIHACLQNILHKHSRIRALNALFLQTSIFHISKSILHTLNKSFKWKQHSMNFLRYIDRVN